MRKRKSPRAPKFTPKYQDFLDEEHKKQRKVTTHYWQRSVSGDIIPLVSLLSSDAPEEIAQPLAEFEERLKKTRGYKDCKEVKFDCDPNKNTPEKAITDTPRHRNFVKTSTARIELGGHKIRVINFQEQKITPEKIKDLPDIVMDEKIQTSGLEKLKKRLEDIQNEENNSIVKIEKNISRSSIIRARKKAKTEHDSKELSANEIFSHHLHDPDCPLDEEQKLIQMKTDHEHSHLIARSQGGNVTLPATEAHNSTRIPMEGLVPFFLHFTPRIQLKTEDSLLRDKKGELTLLPKKEVVSIALPALERRIAVEFKPLSPEQPVHGCFDISKEIAVLALARTPYSSPATERVDKINKKRLEKQKMKGGDGSNKENKIDDHSSQKPEKSVESFLSSPHGFFGKNRFQARLSSIAQSPVKKI